TVGAQQLRPAHRGEGLCGVAVASGVDDGRRRCHQGSVDGIAGREVPGGGGHVHVDPLHVGGPAGQHRQRRVGVAVHHRGGEFADAASEPVHSFEDDDVVRQRGRRGGGGNDVTENG